MPIAWFSTEKYDVFHFCLNCPRIPQIELKNLDFHLVKLMSTQHPELDPCDECTTLFENDECEPTDSISEVRNVIAQ